MGCAVRQLGDGIRHNSRGQDFGEEPRALFSRDIKHVGRHTASAERRQRLRNGVVVAGPVGAEQDDVAVGEGFLDFRLAEGYALVDLAAEAPAGGEVDEDGAALGLIFVNGFGGPGLPADPSKCRARHSRIVS